MLHFFIPQQRMLWGSNLLIRRFAPSFGRNPTKRKEVIPIVIPIAIPILIPIAIPIAIPQKII